MHPPRFHNTSTRSRRGRLRAWAAAALGAALALGDAGAASAGPGETVVVLSGDAAPYRAAEESLDQLLSSAGAVRTVQIDQLTSADLDDLASKTTGAVIAVGTPAAVRLHQRLPARSPLVYCMVSDPERAGLVGGERPTPGVSAETPIADQLDVLKHAFPQARSIGMLYRGSSKRSAENPTALREALGAGFRVVAVDLDKYPDVAAGVKALVAAHPDVVWTAADTAVFDTGTIKTLLKETLAARVPVFGFSLQFVRAGALVGIGVTPQGQAAQAAALAQRLMAGDSPRAEALPPRVRLAVNTTVARRLGVSLPESFMRSVDETYGE